MATRIHQLFITCLVFENQDCVFCDFPYHALIEKAEIDKHLVKF